MPVLKNPKHEIFAQALADGKTQIDAHGIAGFKPHRGNASALAQDKNIVARTNEILAERARKTAVATEKAVEKLALTKEWVLGLLMENAQRALQHVAVKNSDGEETGEYKYDGNVANRALELLGKQLGLFIERHEHGEPGEFDQIDNAADLRRILTERAEELGARDVAARLAGSEGEPGPSRRSH